MITDIKKHYTLQVDHEIHLPLNGSTKLTTLNKRGSGNCKKGIHCFFFKVRNIKKNTVLLNSLKLAYQKISKDKNRKA